jgi:hypothetical protein
MADGVKHFLYLLPDVAYAVELVPNKDGNAYVIRDYLQVNGEFMDDNVILPQSMEKLSGKLQPQPYDLILPDFLFTNTVINVEKTGDDEVKKYINEELVPSLELSADTHSIQSFVLTEHKGTSKVQLSALELSVLDPVRDTLDGGNGPTIRNVYPLSWTLKSLISLEPSISLVQMGGNLYLAQHYIGVDQANYGSAEDVEKLVETVKTLKGAEPSIQTLYLLSSALVESKLKEGLKDTLPLQQLASESEATEMPVYVKQIIEAGAKTLSIADYKLPVFIMGVGTIKAASPMEASKEEMNKQVEEPEETNLPTPTEIGEGKSELEFADAPKEPEVEDKPVKPAAVDLSQFSNQEEKMEDEEPIEPAKDEPPAKSKADKQAMKPAESPLPPKKTVIKNNTGVNSMVRMIVIGLISFFVTVGIGLGIGLGLLTFTKPADTQQTAETSPTPAAEATPTPTPTPAINRADFTLLVVNATTKAGYAGEVAADLETAGFEDVTGQNAKGDYETGNYVLMTEENPALLAQLSEDTGLELTFAEGKLVEDAAGSYDAVIVLAQ